MASSIGDAQSRSKDRKGKNRNRPPDRVKLPTLPKSYGNTQRLIIIRLSDSWLNKMVSKEFLLLPCLQTIQVSDRKSRTVIGRIRHVTSPIWSRIDWLAGRKFVLLALVLLSSKWIKQFI